MMTEIGSEFWDGCTPLNGSGVAELLPADMDCRYTLCGRTALELVLRDILQTQTVSRAYLPSYCCHTMIEPFVAKGIEPVFYDVFFTDRGIDWDFDRENDCDLVFLMDYFGFRNAQTQQLAADQRQRKKLVVYDGTHALFCRDMDYSSCHYVFGSFRKWFGVNAGFCAKAGSWANFPALGQNTAYTQMRNRAFLDKARFMEGQAVEKSVFLEAFSRAEESLETDYTGYGPDEASLQILKTVNVEWIRQRRRENAAYAIAKINELQACAVHSPYRQVKAGDCPLFVPLKTAPETRAALRGQCIENRLYLPVHWPLSGLHSTGERAGEIYRTELSFVCDQRYTPADMEDAVKKMRSM